jgi:hypothetical protein
MAYSRADEKFGFHHLRGPIALAEIPPTQKQVTITLRLMNIIKKSPVTGTKE